MGCAGLCVQMLSQQFCRIQVRVYLAHANTTLRNALLKPEELDLDMPRPPQQAWTTGLG